MLYTGGGRNTIETVSARLDEIAKLPIAALPCSAMGILNG